MDDTEKLYETYSRVDELLEPAPLIPPTPNPATYQPIKGKDSKKDPKTTAVKGKDSQISIFQLYNAQ